jgi:hypothetical protein
MHRHEQDEPDQRTRTRTLRSMTTHAIDTLHDVVATGQLLQAIAAATQAMANPALDADERMALLGLRESRLHWRVGDAPARLATAQAALKAARLTGHAALVAHSLAALGNAQSAMGDLPAALAHTQQAATGLADMGDLNHRPAAALAVALARQCRGNPQRPRACSSRPRRRIAPPTPVTR